MRHGRARFARPRGVTQRDIKDLYEAASKSRQARANAQAATLAAAAAAGKAASRAAQWATDPLLAALSDARDELVSLNREMPRHDLMPCYEDAPVAVDAPSGGSGASTSTSARDGESANSEPEQPDKPDEQGAGPTLAPSAIRSCGLRVHWASFEDRLLLRARKVLDSARRVTERDPPPEHGEGDGALAAKARADLQTKGGLAAAARRFLDDAAPGLEAEHREEKAKAQGGVVPPPDVRAIVAEQQKLCAEVQLHVRQRNFPRAAQAREALVRSGWAPDPELRTRQRIAASLLLRVDEMRKFRKREFSAVELEEMESLAESLELLATRIKLLMRWQQQQEGGSAAPHRALMKRFDALVVRRKR